MTFLFWFSLAASFYVYFGYPLLLAALGNFYRREVQKKDATPSVSVIIAAYNEEKNIADKIENALNLDYPKDQMEIIVASDGSTDRTEEIAGQYAKSGIRLLRLSRAGKIKALNQAVKKAEGEILVFTDANALFEKDALKKLIHNFADPEVGGVCGNQKYWTAKEGSSASEGESLYWTYDKWIKGLESRIGSVYAADGSIYAIRKNLYVPIEDPAQADDFAISARVVTQGYRLVFEPEAISYEAPPVSSVREFWRKVRVTNHTWRAILKLKETFDPFRHGFYAVEVLSHNVLRYLVPFFLLVAFAANIVLTRESTLYQVFLFGQSLFYGLAFVGYQLRHSPWGKTKLFYGPFYFCLANAAVFLGTLSALRGKRIIVWQPDRRWTPSLARKKESCSSLP